MNLSKERMRKYMREYRSIKPPKIVTKTCSRCGLKETMLAKGKGKWKYCIMCKGEK